MSMTERVILKSMFPTDLEHCQQQANVPQLLQDGDVHHPGCHPHAVWSHSQSLQPHVRDFHQFVSLLAEILNMSVILTCCINARLLSCDE